MKRGCDVLKLCLEIVQIPLEEMVKDERKCLEFLMHVKRSKFNNNNNTFIDPILSY